MSEWNVAVATRGMVRDLLAALMAMGGEEEHVRGFAAETVASWVDEHAVGGVDPIDVLWVAEGEVDRLRRAVAVLRAVVDDLILADVTERGDVRLGDVAYRSGSARQRRIVDRDLLVEWVGADNLADVFRLDDSNLRVTALEALARRRALNEHPGDDGEADFVGAVLDTFLGWNDPAPGTPARKLERIPVSRARWAGELAHGQRRH